MHEPQLSIQQSDTSTSPPIAAPKNKRKGKGPTRGLGLDNYFKANGKIRIEVEMEDGKPVCRHASQLSSTLGSLVRALVSLSCANWASVPEEVKDLIIERLMTHFTFDINHEPVSKYLEHHMGDLYRHFRASLHNRYKTFKSPAEARRKRDRRVTSDADWNLLCDRWESNKFKLISHTNSKNRAVLPFGHRAGTRAFLRYLQKKKEEEGSVLSRIELFKETHYNSKNKWINAEAENIYDKMCDMQTNLTQEGNEAIDDVEICERFLGKKSGYVKGLGWGPKPRSYTRGSSSQSNKAMETELNQLRELVQAQEVRMRKMEEMLMRSYGGSGSQGGSGTQVGEGFESSNGSQDCKWIARGNSIRRK